jgi:peptide/nickel transport system permease protein
VLESPETTDKAVKVAEIAIEAETPIEEGVQKKKLSFGAWCSIIWLVGITVVCFAAPLLPLREPMGPDANDFQNLGVGPLKGGHLLGTDDNGRDVLSRVLWGGRASLIVAVGSIVVGVLIGGLLGLVAGYRGGKTDSVLTSTFNIFLAFPQLVLALTLVSVLSPGTPDKPAVWSDRLIVMIIAIGIVSIPILARITRANALAWSQRDFVTAAEAQGATRTSIMFREVLPNVIPAMLSIALLGVAIVIVIEGGLAIFGLSINNPNPSWGNMIASQIDTIENYPHVWLVPSLLIFITVLALNYVGDVVRRLFDVRESVL